MILFVACSGGGSADIEDDLVEISPNNNEWSIRLPEGSYIRRKAQHGGIRRRSVHNLVGRFQGIDDDLGPFVFVSRLDIANAARTETEVCQ